MINEDLKTDVMEDVTLLKCIGINPVLVHGGGPDINAMLGRLEIPSEFRNGLRVTDRETMRVVQMVLVGKTNRKLLPARPAGRPGHRHQRHRRRPD
jgi:acetylglutamate kinase